MPILVFLLDTSASMNQRTYLGTTYLDIAKGAVEVFMKLRARDPASRGDRYMLVTFDDPPYGVKAGWKENHATFMCELKNLQASGLTTLGHALRTAFDLLNLNRLVSGIDNYGQEAGDPLTGGGRHRKLDELLLEDVRGDGVERRAEVHEQDPGVRSWGVQVVQDVVQSHVDCIIH
ncbi:integrator complex subunit 6 isoform X3 [Syngnathus typhle]|uniref:integrator complex subunit 6 isoform X3 n=1 Tax=Syngnathus typhle TaxID=161592 RepID=UPI002A6A03F5|nr:integrator complex subunit 6 isoform X3 [Syngnathus typhle]